MRLHRPRGLDDVARTLLGSFGGGMVLTAIALPGGIGRHVRLMVAGGIILVLAAYRCDPARPVLDRAIREGHALLALPDHTSRQGEYLAWQEDTAKAVRALLGTRAAYEFTSASGSAETGLGQITAQVACLEALRRTR